MPPSHDILLLHEAGPDRQALASYLERQGLKTTVCDDTKQALAHLGRQGATGKTLLLAHQKRFTAAATTAVDALRAYQTVLIVPSGSDPTPGFQNMVREPFFLDQLVRVIRGTTAPEAAAPEAAAGSNRASETDLLRGIAHAINNPLTAALGWLRLLDTEIEERDQRKRLVHQARAELERLGYISQSLALVANPPPAAVTFDVAPIIGERVNQLALEGARVAYRPLHGRTFMVAGNPLEYDVLLRLLLTSAQDSKSLDQFEVSLDEKNGFVQISVKDPKGIVPDPDALSDLGRLLRVERQHRAMALALGQSIAKRAGGALRCEAVHPRGVTFVLAIPGANKTLEVSKDAP